MMTETATVEKDTTLQMPVEDMEVSDAREAIQAARSLIPVGPSGATPMNFAQQVDFAKTMSQAKFSLPEFLCGNGGDCLAIIDIASRANLSPYMVASMCYLEPKAKRLSFMSQLYHALLIQSRMLIGDLEVSYAGEGDDRTCTVTGTLRSDKKPRSHTSPPLGKVRPPKNENGVIKGSPLWSKKPDVQLFYDTSRDWTRIYCPTATLGIFAPEEFTETPVGGPENARDITSLTDRITGAPKTGEGFADGHADRELSQIAASGGTIIDHVASPGPSGGQGEGSTGAGVSEGTKLSGSRAVSAKARAANEGRSAARKAAGKLRNPKPPSRAAVENAADRAEGGASAPAPSRKEVAKVADRAEAASKAKAASGPLNPAPAAAEPKAKADIKTAEDYAVYARAWIDGVATYLDGEDRWEDERELRDRLKVPVRMRSDLQDRLTRRFDP